MVVYFNHWFSSIGGIIEDLKERWGHSLKIIGSSHNENHVMKDYVDEFYVEKWKDSFTEWLMPFLEEQKPDVFFVKKWTEEIFPCLDEIETMGIKVVVENKELYELLDDKAETYKALEGIVALPSYIKTDNLLHLQDYLKNTDDACFKLNNGEGGESFKHIVHSPYSIMDMATGRHNEITHDDIWNMLMHSTPEERNKFIFMEYLSSPEISADCYNSKKGFICICRDKVSGTRVERIYTSDAVSEACEKICRKLDIRYPFNVQFRLKKHEDAKNFDNYRLLEINPRISGGLYYQTKIDLNICDVCLSDMAGRDWYDIEDYRLKEERLLTHIERPVVIE